MTFASLNTLEADAATRAVALCGRLSIMDVTDGLGLDLISEDEANGSNSLDEAFLAGLENGLHLTDEFLSDK